MPLRDEILYVGRRFVIFDQDVGFSVAMHADLCDPNLRSFMRGEKNVVVGRVRVLGELIWS